MGFVLAAIALLTIGNAFFLGLLKLLFIRSQKRWALLEMQDLLRVVGPLGYYGPCCPQCFFQYAARPASTADGSYELICPVCFYRTKTLRIRRQLVELEQKAQCRFFGRHLGISLGELLALVPGENAIPATAATFFLN